MLLQEFLLHLGSERGLSPNTLRAYEGDIKLFWTICQTISEQQLLFFMEALHKRGYHQNSICRIFTSLKLYIGYLQKQGQVPPALLAFWESPKLQAVIPVVLTEEEVICLLEAASTPDERLIMEFLYATGVRVTELCELNAHEVEGGACPCKGKGGERENRPDCKTDRNED